jgi:RNA polymerase sigma-70 factor (ECF subfamily)
MRSGTAEYREFAKAIVEMLPRLRRFCISRTGDIDGGEDLLQATVERALQRYGQFDGSTKLQSWLYRIAQNLNIDALRQISRRPIHTSDDALLEIKGVDGQEVVEIRSDLAKARHALQQLSEDHRAVYVLVVIEESSYGEAADILGIPTGTVMSRLGRARAKLATHLQTI